MISPSSLAAFSTPSVAPLPRLPEVAGKVTLASAAVTARPASPAVPPSNAPLSRTSPRGSLLDLSV